MPSEDKKPSPSSSKPLLSEDEKLLHFGQMVFGMITDVVLSAKASSADDHSFSRRTVVMPDGKGGNQEVVLLVASSEPLADLMEQGVRGRLTIIDVKPSSNIQ